MQSRIFRGLVNASTSSTIRMIRQSSTYYSLCGAGYRMRVRGSSIEHDNLDYDSLLNKQGLIVRNGSAGRFV